MSASSSSPRPAVSPSPSPSPSPCAESVADFDLPRSDSSPETVDEIVPPPTDFQHFAHISSFQQYEKLYRQSIANPEEFFSQQALKELSWFAPFTAVSHGQFHDGDIAWFLNGKINAAYNCIDRHLAERGDKTAILYEGDEPTEIRSLSYRELFKEVCKFANVLQSIGVRSGDCVAIYMPNVPEAAVAMLACARIGAPHSVVFAGFSAESLKERIVDGKCRVIITANEAKRGGKSIPLKETVDAAIAHLPLVESVIVYERTSEPCHMKAGRDHYWSALMAGARGYCPAQWLDSEHPLFYLYTSGSTGKPKGLQHSTAGYLMGAVLSTKYVFDIHENTIHGCVADIGWITGHTYIVYGPLALGATTFMFESTPLYPDPSRYWAMVERHRLNTFYTAPTAIRAIMKFGDEPVKKHDRSSLRVLGSVGEPINPEAWRWYFTVCGDGRIPIVDTFWQTESGSILMTPVPGATSVKPGSCTFPFFGIEPVILDPQSGKVLEGNNVSGVLALARPWPSISRTIFGDHERYLKTYMHVYPGYYFTGDGCIRDANGYYWITGRVDDVVNVSGHRIGSAEIESALVTHRAVAEAAVVGIPHDLKGQSLFAYVIPKAGARVTDLAHELRFVVREQVGAFAAPDEILITQALPKTRSGKIMRRILRKIASKETDSLGDITTLADPAVVQTLIHEVEHLRQNAKK